MATGTTSYLDALAMDVYPEGSKIFSQFNRSTPLYDLIIKSRSVPFNGKKEGRRIYIPVMTGPVPNAATPVAEEGPIPKGGAHSYDKLTFNVASLWSAVKLTGLAIDTQGGGDMSVADILPREMDQTKRTSQWKMGWFLHGDGSGMIGSVASCSGNQITLAANTDLSLVTIGDHLILRHKTTGAGGFGQTSGVALQVTAKSGSLGATPVLTVVNESGSTPTLTASTTEGVYFYDSQGDAPIGIKSYCSDANPDNWGSATAYLGNVNRSTAGNEWWQGYRLNAAGAVIDLETHLQNPLDQINERAGTELGAEDEMIAVVRYNNWRSVGNQLSRDQRTSAPVETLQGGWSAIQYENCKIVRDRMCPNTVMRFFNPRHFRNYVLRDWNWHRPPNGGPVFKAVASSDGSGRDSDVYQGYLMTRQNILAISCLCAAEVYGLAA